MEIILGLTSAVAFGCGDFCARFAIIKIGHYRTLLYGYILSLGLLSLLLVFSLGGINLSLELIALAAVVGIISSSGGIFLYRSFELGQLSLVAPIASSFGAITLLLDLATGKVPTPIRLAGVVVLIIGVVLVSAPLGQPTKVSSEVNDLKTDKKKPSAARLSLIFAGLASFCFGFGFWGLSFLTPQLGEILPTWIQRLVGIGLVLALSPLLKFSIALPPRSAISWLIGVGVLETTANLAYNFGLQSGNAGIVAVISSLFSAVTVLLALIFLKEKLAPNQWVGIALILLGIGLTSLR